MDLFRIGRVSGTHHLKGTIKVTSNFNDVDILIGNKVILTLKNEQKKVLTISEIKRINDKIILIDFEEIKDKTEASSLIGAEVHVRRDLLGDISEDEFYAEDLVGMEVINSDNTSLGKVEDILETGAHDVLIVNEGVEEVMIPAVELYVLEINFETRIIRVDVPEELININK